MVSRCGWFVRDCRLHCKVVKIEWDLGFSREAKIEYINRMYDALGLSVGISCDVTSASPNLETRNLSPIFVRCKTNNDMTIEDYISSKQIKMQYGTREFNIMSWLYLISLTERNMKTVMAYDCFFDVFANSDREPRNSQAYLLGVLKLMISADKLDLLREFNSFNEYFSSIEYNVIE